MSRQSDPPMENEQKENKRARQIALIGLVGTVLTVCGGVAGALIGGIAVVGFVLEGMRIAMTATPRSGRKVTTERMGQLISVRPRT